MSVENRRGQDGQHGAVVEGCRCGAGDVWDVQPAPKDHPWRTMPHHGMTPHVAGNTLDAQARYQKARARAAAPAWSVIEAWGVAAFVMYTKMCARHCLSQGRGSLQRNGWRRTVRDSIGLPACAVCQVWLCGQVRGRGGKYAVARRRGPETSWMPG